jgi:hypothetical protein
MASSTRPRATSDMPRTLRQLWADEDDAHQRAAARRRRAIRLRTKHGDHFRGSALTHGKARTR